MDLRGFTGLSNDVRKGYSEIQVTFRVRTDEPDLEKLKGLTDFSPVFDVVRHGTNVQVEIERM